MIPYRQTSDTFAIYDNVCVRQSDTFAIGKGRDVCMCFSFNEMTEKQSDYCVLVDANGQGDDYVEYMRGKQSASTMLGDRRVIGNSIVGNLGTQNPCTDCWGYSK
jgi:hypothetical protein